MAGGRFDKLVGKTLPGTYINFESGRETSVVNNGTRGTVIIPLPKNNYGPEAQFIRLTSENPDAAADKLGYSVYDDDPKRQMLLIREAFKRATTVYVYNFAGGSKAQKTITMTLPEPETNDVDKKVVEEFDKELKKGDAVDGVKVSIDHLTKTITATFSKAPSQAKEMALSRLVQGLITQEYEVYIDGQKIESKLSEVKEMPFYKKLQKLEQGGPDVTCTMAFTKDSVTQEYTIVFTYPSSVAYSAQAGGLEDVTKSENTLTAAAMYGGSRGNDLTVTIDENPLGGWDVIIHLAGDKVVEYEGLETVEELIAQNNPYITFTGSGLLGAVAGENLTGGTDGEVSNSDITAFIDAWESIRFDTVAFPFDDADNKNVKQAALTKIKYMRESMGRGVQVVIPNAGKMDYEGVINVTNSVSLDGDDLTVAEACAWVAGATAGASNTESLTYIQYAGATSVVGPKSNEEAVAAVNAGELFFTVNEDDEVVVMYDINTLITYADKKDKSYRKNRVIRVYDTFQQSVQNNFPPNKFDNNERGWDIMEGIGKAILRQFEDAGAIRNVSYDEDFLVDREASVDDETYFNVGLQAVDSAEKLYFTITTR